MIERAFPIVFLPGAGNHPPDLMRLLNGPQDSLRFEVVFYPSWRRYVGDGFSTDGMIAELASAIAQKVPRGPIHIVGLSIGGHFGYAAALRLRAAGREIGGFCAIDSFMIETEAPRRGWVGRAASEALEMLGKRRFREFGELMRSKFWRALLRLQGLLPRRMNSPRGGSLVKLDPMLERELGMRMMLRTMMPWLARLDDNPVSLDVPSCLIRTPVTAGDDAAWERRCPKLKIYEVFGHHQNLFEPENIGRMREVFTEARREWRY